MILIHHLKGASLLRKDQKRRLQYQAKQQLVEQTEKDSRILRRGWDSRIELSEGQLKSFTSKLVK